MTDSKKYTIVRCRRKTVALQVTREAEVVVRAPRYVSAFFIEEFVREHVAWVEKRKQEIKKRKKSFVEGELFLFLGNIYPLTVMQTGDRINFSEAEGFSFGRDALNPQKLFEDWYKKQARNILPRRVGELAEMYGFEYNTLRITSARTRWGSCSGKRNISLSWRLVLAPKSVIDYVIIHELTHLEHMNHSKVFWNKVARLCPEYRQHKRWLSVAAKRDTFLSH